MIDREHDLSITKQAAALNFSRGSVYYLPRPVSASDLDVMRRLDRLHLQFPFAGSRMLRGLLAAEGCKIGRRPLMKRMGIEALYRRPRRTKPEPGHKVYSYLLRDLEITRPNQVWAMDITYLFRPRLEENVEAFLAPARCAVDSDDEVFRGDDGSKFLRRGTRRRLGSSRQTRDRQ